MRHFSDLQRSSGARGMSVHPGLCTRSHLWRRAARCIWAGGLLTASMLHTGINTWELQPPQRATFSLAGLVKIMEDYRMGMDWSRAYTIMWCLHNYQNAGGNCSDETKSRWVSSVPVIAAIKRVRTCTVCTVGRCYSQLARVHNGEELSTGQR